MNDAIEDHLDVLEQEQIFSALLESFGIQCYSDSYLITNSILRVLQTCFDKMKRIINCVQWQHQN